MSAEVPETWEETKLGEIAALSGGSTPSKAEEVYWRDGTAPWATPSDITRLPMGSYRIAATETQVTELALQQCSLKLYPAGTVLMTSRATIGYAAINDVPMATNQGFLNFVCHECCDPEYLCIWLNANRRDLMAAAGGSTFKELSRGTAKLLPILLPPLDEQRAIVEVIRSVDETIRLTEQASLVARSTFNRLIDDLYSLYEDKLVSLVHYCEPKGLQTGPFGSQLKVADYVEMGIPVVMPIDLKSEGIDFTGAKATSLDKANRLPQHHLRAGDILFSRRGDVEKCGLYMEGDPPALCGTGCLRARIDTSKADPVLIYFLVQSAKSGSWLKKYAVGVTMPNLNTSIIGALPVPHLPMDEQKKWVEALLLAEGVCRANELQLARLSSLKQAVAYDLLFGKVRVPA